MSAESVFIRSLEFTNSVGRRGTDDSSFYDVIKYGGFPWGQHIKGITKIEVFSDKKAKDAAVIIGLNITYKLDNSTGPVTARHGNVDVDDLIGEFAIDDDQLLVGVYGRIKDRPGHESDGRLASISFVLFNKAEGRVEALGPFHGSAIGSGKVWASFGDIVAFSGTRADGVGLTSLGFTLDTSN